MRNQSPRMHPRESGGGEPARERSGLYRCRYSRANTSSGDAFVFEQMPPHGFAVDYDTADQPVRQPQEEAFARERQRAMSPLARQQHKTVADERARQHPEDVHGRVEGVQQADAMRAHIPDQFAALGKGLPGGERAHGEPYDGHASCAKFVGPRAAVVKAADVRIPRGSGPALSRLLSIGVHCRPR